MEFDLNGEHKRYAYKLLAGLITPRPIAWVTTQDENGVVNAAPFSFFNVFGTRPPILGFAPGDKEPGIPKDTARNIRRTGEFVVNLVDEASAEVMNQSSQELDHGISEVALLKLETTPSVGISPPRLTIAPVALECRERIHTRAGVLDPDSLLVNPDAFSPIGRMEVPSGYCRTRDRFQMTRPD